MTLRTKSPSSVSSSLALLPPRQVAKLSRCGCDPSWFCSPHDMCFIHESCLCEGSSRWPPVKPVRSPWVSMSHEWLAGLLSVGRCPHLPSPCALGQQVITLLSLSIRCPYCLCPSFCLVPLLSAVASSYAIVQTTYCCIVAIVSNLLIVITYAYYWVV
jgi:hypothetical protein